MPPNPAEAEAPDAAALQARGPFIYREQLDERLAAATAQPKTIRTRLRLMLSVARLLEQGAAPHLLVSGAHARLTLPELARAHGRDPAALTGRVALGWAAATTLGNAVEVAAYVRGRGIGSVRLVTAGYHMPRALLELRRAAPGLEVVPHPVVPPGLRADDRPNGRALSGLRRWTLLSGEYLKYVAAAAGLTRFLPAKEQALR
jgi:uncharacterized SAM-binding protein YcdF (DUF218 family)